MKQEPENLIDVDKVNQTPMKIKLIYLSLLALGIKLESTFIPTTKSELDLVIEYVVEVAQNKEERIRRACSLLEQIDNSDDVNYYYGIVKDYLEKFSDLCRSPDQTLTNNIDLSVNIPPEQEFSIAIKTLTDLLFYSTQSGKNYLKQHLQCL